jgi:hypothetical protein
MVFVGAKGYKFSRFLSGIKKLYKFSIKFTTFIAFATGVDTRFCFYYD